MYSNETGWCHVVQRARVFELHARKYPSDITRTIYWNQPTDSALVVGSAQSLSDIRDTQYAQPPSLVKRASGGGAVLVTPDNMIWFDVVIGVHDPLWDCDITRSFFWLGATIRDALAACGCDALELHEAGLTQNAWSQLVCAASVGPGEVMMKGRKVVGLSQKRRRAFAVFQCMINRKFAARAMSDALGIAELQRSGLERFLDAHVANLEVDPIRFRNAFERQLDCLK